MAAFPMTSIRTSGDKIEIINQLLLPHTGEWLEIKSVEEAHAAIKSMQIRGAPAIASLASLTLAAHLSTALASSPPPTFLESPEALHDHVEPILAFLFTARPTAVNLGAAIARLRSVLDAGIPGGDDARAIAQRVSSADVAREIARRLVAEGRAVADEDVGRNKEMGRHGGEWLIERIKQREGKTRKLRVLTVCNTGSLATSGYGTAIGVITYLFETGHLERAYYTQSAPYHQGSRLTALEFLTLGLPSCMICDTMVGSLFQHHQIDAVFVGADRVVRNGDTANKIGTYNAAVLAARHEVPFVVVAPVSTVDLAVRDGYGIPIEHRPPLEACTARGALVPPVLGADGTRVQATVLITPVLSAIRALVTAAEQEEEGAPFDAQLQQVYNPSFDVTPAELISCIVTEKGVAVKDAGASVYALDGSAVV